MNYAIDPPIAPAIPVAISAQSRMLVRLRFTRPDLESCRGKMSIPVSASPGSLKAKPDNSSAVRYTTPSEIAELRADKKAASARMKVLLAERKAALAAD